MNYNKLILGGNLVRSPDLKYIAAGTAVAKFGIAVNRKYTVNGEKREETTFVDCEAWAKQAELISEHFTKGSPIFVEGRLKLDQWETKDGQKRSKLRMVVERFEFMPKGAGEQASRAADPAPSGAAAATDNGDPGIPF